MKCRYTSLISRFIDRELDKERSKILKEHLKSCTVCKEEFEVLTKIKAAFIHKLDYSVSPDFTDRVVASLPERKTHLAERFNMWIDDIFPLTKKLIPVPLALAILLILFITTHDKTLAPISIEEVLLENHFSQEEILVLSDAKLSSEVALELLIE